MSQVKTAIVDPNTLTRNPWNTNIQSPENQDKLRESIKRFGMFRPLVVRELGEELQILGGEHRWELAIEMGIQVPIINVGPIEDKMAKEISIADNARYGTDDTLAFAELLKELGTSEELQIFLPYTETDFADLFSSTDISLEDLGIEENFDREEANEQPEEPIVREPKTHTIMRMRVSLQDAQRVTALVAKTQKLHDFTASDELTNTGDAIVHLLLGQDVVTAEVPPFNVDDINALLEEATS